MNWYYNNAGAAEGPMDDQAMTELVRAKKLVSDSLVWHAGLEAWQTVAVLAPSWWAASLLTPAGRPAPVAAKTPAKEKADSGGRRLSGPNAPNTEASEIKAGGGFLKRLFGFGKKKD
ncbi:MAG: hypothetical protein B7Z37_12860 [Verrucomicrobia bacterium 12-59-8]|nr:MAG: hypothetical protein B7Z37_12860 [Verrucomicrobia bacterium 12-59-8]